MKFIKEILQIQEDKKFFSASPLKILIQHMKSHGYKKLTVNGGSYGYSTSIDQLTKPIIPWVATDGSIVKTKSMKELGKYMSRHLAEDWNSFWDQETVDTIDLEDLIDSINLIVFSKTNIDQQKWEDYMRTGDLKEDKITNPLLKKMIKAADLGHVVDGRKWKPGEYAAYLEKLAKEKKV